MLNILLRIIKKNNFEFSDEDNKKDSVKKN